MDTQNFIKRETGLTAGGLPVADTLYRTSGKMLLKNVHSIKSSSFSHIQCSGAER
jgi:hypothetical protein